MKAGTKYSDAFNDQRPRASSPEADIWLLRDPDMNAPIAKTDSERYESFRLAYLKQTDVCIVWYS